MTVHKLKESISVGQAGTERRVGLVGVGGGGPSLPWETILCAT